jgi:signal transduction histidine kinase/DNA-binding response OmpR family regulator
MASSRILIVDDEPRMVNSLKTLLTMEGYEVMGENDPAEALGLLERSDFDLMIADIKMPQYDGIELMRRAREKDPYMGVILITGYASLETAKNAVGEGAFGYLTKPLEFDELKLAVARGIEKRKIELERLRLLTELKVANETLQMKLVQLDALSSAGNLLATTVDLKEALTAILSLAIDVIGAKLGSVMILDANQKELYIGASCGLEDSVVQNTRMKLGSSISGYVAKTGRPLIVEDIEKDPRFARINRQKYESKSLVSVPLIYKDRVLGVINLNNKTSGKPFTEDDLRLLHALAVPAAVAIDRANLIAEKIETINYLTVLHGLAEKVSMLDDPKKIGEITFEGMRKLISLESIFWYDYLERSGELLLEFHHGQLSENAIPEYLQAVKLGNETITIGKPADTELLQDILIRLFENFREVNGHSFKVVPLPIIFRRALAGVAVLVFPPDYQFTDSLRELAVLALTQTAAIYQRQKAVLNATQLVTMGRLIAEIGHDLKKPLTNIKGITQIYKERIKGKNAREFFPEAEKEIGRLTELVKEMVEFSDPNKYETRKLSISELLDKSLKLLNSDLQNREIHLVKNYGPRQPEVMVNEPEMFQVFINILQNAVDSMDRGGTLTINVQEIAEDDLRWLRVRIEDTGIGISEEDLGKIFTRYYTTKQTGTGLGLAIAERIILVHNGRISVKSKVGKGTTFMIDLRA